MGGDDDTGDEDHDGLVETEDPEEPRMYALPLSPPHYEVPDIPPPPPEPVEAPKELAESRRVKWVGEMKSSGANSQLLPRVDANQDPTTATFYLDLAKATYIAPSGSIEVVLPKDGPVSRRLEKEDRFDLNLHLLLDESRFELVDGGSLVEGRVQWSESSDRVLVSRNQPKQAKKANWNLKVKADAPVGWTDLLVSAWIRQEPAGPSVASPPVWMPAGEFQMPVCIFDIDAAKDCPPLPEGTDSGHPPRLVMPVPTGYGAQIHFVESSSAGLLTARRIFGIMYTVSKSDPLLWAINTKSSDQRLADMTACVENQNCIELGKSLFPEKAMERLAELPDESSIFVRNTIEYLPYVPVDLVLNKESTVFQDLIGDSDPIIFSPMCIQQWAEMVPRNGGGLNDPAIRSISEKWKSTGASQQCDSPKEMFGWLMGADECASVPPLAEEVQLRHNIGLLWVSHFDGQFFGWPEFNAQNEDDDKMKGPRVVANSLAILHVCDGAQFPDSPPLDRFSDLGFGSIITTISKIKPDVALAFNDCWDHALAAPDGQAAQSTVGDLYEKTRRCLRARGLSEQKYYQFFGNPDLTICLSPPSDLER